MVFDSTLLILLVLAGLGIISQNMTVTLAILVLLVIRITPLATFFPWVEKHGLTIGIVVLTIGVLAPLASGKITAQEIIGSFFQWQSILAIVIGVMVSWLGGRGVSLMSNQPSTVAGLLVGTVLGVALFRGVPVGPLIAAGMLSLIIGKGWYMSALMTMKYWWLKALWTMVGCGVCSEIYLNKQNNQIGPVR